MYQRNISSKNISKHIIFSSKIYIYKSKRTNMIVWILGRTQKFAQQKLFAREGENSACHYDKLRLPSMMPSNNWIRNLMAWTRPSIESVQNNVHERPHWQIYVRRNSGHLVKPHWQEIGLELALGRKQRHKIHMGCTVPQREPCWTHTKLLNWR